MRVNKGLMIAATFDPTKRTSLITVADMCRKIEENSISLPLYQRDISWTLQKCIDLLNYQLWGKAPVSPISINVINTVDSAVPQVSFIDREIISTIERGQYSVVDGQQRLTTNYKAYCNHDDFRHSEEDNRIHDRRRNGAYELKEACDELRDGFGSDSARVLHFLVQIGVVESVKLNAGAFLKLCALELHGKRIVQHSFEQ